MAKLTTEYPDIIAKHMEENPQNSGDQISLEEGTDNAIQFLNKNNNIINAGLQELKRKALLKLEKK